METHVDLTILTRQSHFILQRVACYALSVAAAFASAFDFNRVIVLGLLTNDRTYCPLAENSGIAPIKSLTILSWRCDRSKFPRFV
ncbi:MAG: hypothetical protein RMX65_006890 [Nostoc sp. DedQUE01]